MAEQGYDGSIRIDTRIDESGINDGMANVTDAVEGEFAAIGNAAEAGTQTIGNSFLSLLPAVKGVFGKILGVIGGLSPALIAVSVGVLGLGLGMFKAFQGVLSIVQRVREGLRMLVQSLVEAVRNVIGRFVSSITKTVSYITRILFRQLILSIIRAAREVMSAAKEVNQLQSSFNELSTTIKYLAADFISLFVPQIQSAVSWLINLLNIIRQVIAALKGQSTYTKIVAKGLGEAGGAAEKAAGSLAAFDELDVLQQQPEGGGGGGGGFGEEEVPIDDKWIKLAELIAAAWEKVKAMFLELWEVLKPFREFLIQTATDFYNSFLKPVAEWILGPGWEQFIKTTQWIMDNADFDKLAASLDRFYKAAAKLTIAVFQGLLTFYDRFLAPIAVWTINEGLPRFLDALSEAIEGIDFENVNEHWGKFLDSLTRFAILNLENMLKFVTDILIPLGAWAVNEVLPRFFDLLGNVLDILSGVLEALQPLWDRFYEKVLVPLATWTGGAFLRFLDWLNEKLELLSAWIQDNPEKIQKFFTFLGVTAAVLLGALLLVLTPVILSLAGLGVAIAIISINLAIVAAVIGAVIVAFSAIAALIAVIVVGAFYLLIKIIQGLITFLGGLIQIIIRVAGALIGYIGTAIMFVIDRWKQFIEALKTGGLKGAINFIIGQFEQLVNKIIAGINSLIDKINGIKFTFPSITIFGQTFGGGSFSGLGIPRVPNVSIPRLASGAVIPPNSAFMAVLGDQRAGRNIETPEKLMRQIVREELESLGAGSQDVTINFAGSLGALVRELKPYIDKENGRIGMSLVRGV